ncbi:hypothetical protein ABDJ41_01885 [Pedobacter sp. ASV1-7]|uniref:hypothetical protein n=1 Tax=Pedobacter sp. ASV1-7 TaxID=3145237 RepID=UPI0032E8DA10
MAVEAGKKYMILRWFAAALLFVALSLTAFTLYLGAKLKPIFTAKIKELVLEATNNLYRIEFSGVNVNALTGISSLTDVKIIPDTAVYRRMVETKQAPNNLYHIKLKKLAIRNFHPWRLWRYKQLNIDLLLFDNPCVEMVNRQFDFNDDKLPQPKQSPYDYISKYLKELHIRTVDFKNASFKYIDNNGEKPEIDAIENLNVTLKDWLIDSNSANDESRIYLLKDVVINLNNYSYSTPDSLYYIKFNQLDFASSSGVLNVKNFNVEPRYNEREFGSNLGYAKDRYSVQVSDIGFTGINLPLYVLKHEFFAKEMSIANGSLTVVNNNTLPKKVENKMGQYPHQLLQKAHNKLSIEKLNIKNVDISYAEFDKDGQNKGIVTFDRTWGTISNVTNDEKVKVKNHFMEANLSSSLMGSGKLDVNFKFDLTAKNGDFSYSGNLINMEGKALNRITRPLGLVKFNSGYINKLEFDIHANDHFAKGEVIFAYKDLSVSLLKKAKGEDRLVKQGLMSFLANALIIRSDNPDANGLLIKAPVMRERKETASFFNFIWKALFQGVKYSVGLTPQKEKEIKAKIASFEKRKADRQERIKRREQRLKKRE